MIQSILDTRKGSQRDPILVGLEINNSPIKDLFVALSVIFLGCYLFFLNLIDQLDQVNQSSPNPYRRRHH